jgi:hypothetical protein
MDDHGPARIRIGEDELASPEVDAVLARQQSFGVATAAAKVPERKASLLYRPWFALLVAGALGGLAGWAVVEPFVDDGLQFHARVDAVQRAPPGEDGATLTASGLEVVLRPEITHIFRDRKPAGVDALEVGAHVVVRGQQVASDGAPVLLAYEVTVVPGEPPHEPASLSGIALRDALASLVVFPGVAALVGLFLAAADGLLSRAWRRATLCALVGLSSGLGLGFIAAVLAEVVYSLGQGVVAGMRTGDQPTAALLAQMLSRGIAWAFVGTAMGLGQGIALRSRRMLMNGLLGGVIGALIGGLMFDPIDRLFHHGTIGASADLSRAVGFVVIGATTGLMIGVVELLARDAWLKMLAGPLAGKEFVLFKNPTVIGSSPKSDVYLFKDPGVEPTHALIHVLGEGHELEVQRSAAAVFLNGRPVRRTRLVHGDQLRIGKTVLSFSVKEG